MSETRTITLDVEVPLVLFDQDRDSELEAVLQFLRREQTDAIRCSCPDVERYVTGLIGRLKDEEHRR